MYNELVYNLDLCILSYQLYSQTLVWPMDPYYEQMRKKLTNRRTNFIAEVHDNKDELDYPAVDRRFDPIIFDYSQINPWNDCFSKPEDKWDIFSAPQEIVKPIIDAYFVEKDGRSTKKANNPGGSEGKTDLLYCFQGVTGKIKERDGVKSLLGFVLAREVDVETHAYEVHIVFRGSRSGSGGRAFAQGKFSERGNADWITDMDFGILIEDKEKYISDVGKVCRGFSACIKETKPAILKCLEEIYNRKNKGRENKIPPRQITIAGHSLGGALSAHLASSLLQDFDGSDSGKAFLKSWPIPSMRVFTYGCPVIGDRAFCDNLGARVKITRCYAGGDPITQETFNFQGWPLTPQTHAGTVLKLSTYKPMSLLSHEPTNIRKNLVEWLKDLNPEKVAGIPGKDYKTKGEETDDGKPWQIREKLKDVLALSAIKSKPGKTKAFMPKFTEEYFEPYMNNMIAVMRKTDSYVMGSKVTDIPRKVKALEKLLETNERVYKSAKQLNLMLKTYKDAIDDDATYNLVGCMMLLRLFAENPENPEEMAQAQLPENDALCKIMKEI